MARLLHPCTSHVNCLRCNYFRYKKSGRERNNSKVGCGVRLCQSILILGRKRDSAILLLFVLRVVLLLFLPVFTIPTPVCQSIDIQRVRDLLLRATRPCHLHTRRRTNTEVSYVTEETEVAKESLPWTYCPAYARGCCKRPPKTRW